MENFIAYNPTKVHFGKNVVKTLGETVKQYGRKMLLVYGKASIKKNGIYNEVMSQFPSSEFGIIEYEGIKPNPVFEDVDSASELGIQHDVEVVVAVGGGSVIDSAKIISLCIANKAKAWDIMKKKQAPDTAVPVIAILTLAATGTEMNPYAVLQNHETQEKIGYGNELMFPKHSFLDPRYTFSVPGNYTAYGVADLMAHSMEAWFGIGDATLSDRIIAGIMHEALEYGPKVLEEPDHYEYRAKIMWAATVALNGYTDYGRKSGDWGVHAIGHVLSLLYDVPHGATLSIAYIAWLTLQKERIPERIGKLGEYVFGTSDPEETIQKLKSFFQHIGSPVSLKEVKLGDQNREEILNVMLKNKVSGYCHRLTKADHESLFEQMNKG